MRDLLAALFLIPVVLVIFYILMRLALYIPTPWVGILGTLLLLFLFYLVVTE